MFIKYTLHTFTKINNILKTKKMKTTQILKALNIVSNQYTRNHCSKLADIFSLLKEIKKDITEVLLLESELVYIGKTTEIKYRNREIVSNGIEMEGQKIQVTFTKGVYTFTLPIDNEFYFVDRLVS